MLSHINLRLVLEDECSRQYKIGRMEKDTAREMARRIARLLTNVGA